VLVSDACGPGHSQFLMHAPFSASVLRLLEQHQCDSAAARRAAWILGRFEEGGNSFSLKSVSRLYNTYPFLLTGRHHVAHISPHVVAELARPLITLLHTLGASPDIMKQLDRESTPIERKAKLRLVLERALSLAGHLRVLESELRMSREQLASVEGELLQHEQKQAMEAMEEEQAERVRQARYAELGVEINTPKEHLCPISFCPMRDPVVASDGHSYDRASITPILEGPAANRRSPLTRETLLPRVYANHTLRKLIEEYEDEATRLAQVATAHGRRLEREQIESAEGGYGSSSGSTEPLCSSLEAQFPMKRKELQKNSRKRRHSQSTEETTL